jgi:ABC-type hemin transport system substrate-binding protein
MAKKAKAEPKPAATKAAAAHKAAKPASKPALKAAKPGTIIIAGEGTVPIYGDGAMRRVPRGVPIDVTDAERSFIERSSLTIE